MSRAISKEYCPKTPSSFIFIVFSSTCRYLLSLFSTFWIFCPEHLPIRSYLPEVHYSGSWFEIRAECSKFQNVLKVLLVIDISKTISITIWNLGNILSIQLNRLDYSTYTSCQLRVHLEVAFSFVESTITREKDHGSKLGALKLN